MKRRLIMFVHGLGGSGQSTWRCAGCEGFPEHIPRDRAVYQDADVAFFDYPTSPYRLPFSRKAPAIRDLAEGLRSELDTVYPEYRSIALVCHSLGGLVARKYLVEEVKRGSELRVDKLLLFAVPHHGAELAKVGSFVSWRHNQLRQLCRNSGFVEELSSDWARLEMADRMEVTFVVGSQDRVVEKQSAINEWGEDRVRTILDGDHLSVVKPKKPTDLAYRFFRDAVLGPARVFLSVGGGRTDRQDAVLKAVKSFLLLKGIEAKTVDEYTATNKQPLKDVEFRMNRCFGAVVLAFERTYVQTGLWRRGAGTKLEKGMKDLTFAPVWNQIEAAMAYTLGLPLLVLAEQGLNSEGLLESKYDWRVKWIDLDAPVIEDPEFLGMFEDWREHVLVQRDGVLRESVH